jgi:hypothetical protein
VGDLEPTTTTDSYAGQYLYFAGAMRNKRPWTAAEDALLGTHLDSVIARGLRRSLTAVAARRNLLNIAAFARPANWGATELAMLGHYSDAELARITGRAVGEVNAKRLEIVKSHRRSAHCVA